MALQKAGVQLVVEGGAQATAAMASFGRAVNDASDQTMRASGRVSNASQIMVGALRQVGVVAVDAFLKAGRAAVGFVADSVKAAGNFQQGMSVLQAVTSATDAQMAALQKTAIALGNDITLPATSATDAAEAMTELAKAGLSVEQAMDAAKGTLQLATAAEVDNARAAQIVAGALNAFHMEGSQAVQVADLLAAAANASSASMTDLSQGLQQGGFMFNATGQKVDDLVASLAILTNVGLTGSDAGTALKNAMTRLINPTDGAAQLMERLGINVFDASGKMLPFREIIGILDTALSGLSEQERLSALSTIFLSDGMKAMIPLIDGGIAGFDAMKEKVNQQGAAAQLAGAQTAGFNGALAAAKNAAETLGLTIGMMLLPPLTDLLNNYVTPGIAWFSALATAMSESNAPMATFATHVTAAIPGLAGVVAQLTALTTSSPVVTSAIAQLSAAFTAGETPVQGFLNVLSLVSPGFALLRGVVEQAMPAIQTLITTVFGQVALFMQAHGAEITLFMTTTWATIQEIISMATTLIAGVITVQFGAISGFISDHSAVIQTVLSTAWTIISGLITSALEIIKGVLQTALAVFQGDWSGAWTAILGLTETINGQILGVVTALLETMANAFGSSLKEIAQVWSHNFLALVDIVTGMVGKFVSAGAAIIDGVISGVKSRAGALFSALKDLANDALEAAKSAINMGSPARKAYPIGKAMPDGMVVGVQQGAGELLAAMAGIAADALSAAKGELDGMGSVGSGAVNQIAGGINAAAGAAISAAKRVAGQINSILGGIGGGGGGLSLGPSGSGSDFFGSISSGGGGGASLFGAGIAPPASAAQIMSAGATTITNTQSRTYNYSPTYGGAPRAPSVDFATMAAWGS
jgi:TP901 family phage tail tape measure protein